MKIVYVQVTNVTNPLPQSRPCSVHSFSLRCSSGSIGTNLILNWETLASGAITWGLDFKEQYSTRIELILNENIPNVGISEQARLIIPLKWFLANTVVIEWYPMKLTIDCSIDIMVQLSIHVCSNRAMPFQARLSKLLIDANWRKPMIPACSYAQIQQQQQEFSQFESRTHSNPSIFPNV